VLAFFLHLAPSSTAGSGVGASPKGSPLDGIHGKASECFVSWDSSCWPTVFH
jgi:hypothetical protein